MHLQNNLHLMHSHHQGSSPAWLLPGSCPPVTCGLVLCPQLHYSSAFLSCITPLPALTRDPRTAGVPRV